MSRVLYPKRDGSNFRLMRVRDGQINMCVYEKHIALHFEPWNNRYYTILRLYTRSGELIKQWKGIGFGKGCGLHVDYMNSTNDKTEVCEDGIHFFCENNEELISCEDDQISLYDLFPSLPKYE